MEELVEKIKCLQQVYENSTLDVRAEVIITELIRNGLDIDNFLFNSTGTLNRGHRKDIIGFKVDEFATKKIVVSLSREGLYDYLPQGLFFPINETSQRKNSSEMSKNVKQNDQIELDARKFFSPIDTIFEFVRIEAEQEARSLNEESGINNQGPLGIIWELPKNLKSHERNLLILLLPFTRLIIESPSLISGFYSLFFNANFIINTTELVSTSEICESSGLGECYLGYSSVLGGALSHEHSAATIEYTITNEHDLHKFKPGNEGDQLIDFLNSFFLPAECLSLKKANVDALKPILNLDNESHYILDYSAFLSE